MEALIASDRGSAALEFIVAGVLLLVPLIYLIVSLGLVQSQSMGVDAAARYLVRAFATGTGSPDQVLETIVDQYRIDPDTVAVTVTCAPAGGACPRAGATMTVTVAASVGLPLAPTLFGIDQLARIPVEASAVQKVSIYEGAP